MTTATTRGHDSQFVVWSQHGFSPRGTRGRRTTAWTDWHREATCRPPLQVLQQAPPHLCQHAGPPPRAPPPPSSAPPPPRGGSRASPPPTGATRRVAARSSHRAPLARKCPGAAAAMTMPWPACRRRRWGAHGLPAAPAATALRCTRGPSPTCRCNLPRSPCPLHRAPVPIGTNPGVIDACTWVVILGGEPVSRQT